MKTLHPTKQQPTNMHDILKHVGKARIIVFYYSAHTYVVSLSTKLQKRQTSYKEKIKIPNIENILAIIFPLPHVQTFSLIQLVTHIQIHIFTFISSLKSYQFLYAMPILFSRLTFF